MKKNILLILFSIGIGILITFFVLNNENIYAKEEYLAYAFQIGSYESESLANNIASSLPSYIIVQENNYYNVYSAIYKNIDIVNKMVNYYEEKGLKFYLKTINVNKNFYEILDNYEIIILNSKDSVYDNINQSILNLFIESGNL